MKLALVLFAALLPSLAAAQVEGIKFVQAHKTALGDNTFPSYGIVVGEKFVAVPSFETQRRLNFFNPDGTQTGSWAQPQTVRAAVWSGPHLYVSTDIAGFNVYDEGGALIQNISGPRMNDISILAAAPDGKTIFALWHEIATLAFYDRDTKTGKLTKRKQVIQTDDEGTRMYQKSYERRGLKMPIEKGSIRVERWANPVGMKVSDDGNYLFFAINNLGAGVFGKDDNG